MKGHGAFSLFKHICEKFLVNEEVKHISLSHKNNNGECLFLMSLSNLNLGIETVKYIENLYDLSYEVPDEQKFAYLKSYDHDNHNIITDKNKLVVDLSDFPNNVDSIMWNNGYNFYKIVDKNGNNGYHHAAFFGNLEILKYLETKGEEVCHSLNKLSFCQYYLAALAGKISVLEYLDDRWQTDLTIRTCHENNFYIQMCRKGHVETVKYLDKCSDKFHLNSSDLHHINIGNNMTPYLVAIKHNNYKVLEHFLSEDIKNTDIKNTDIEKNNDILSDGLQLAACYGSSECFNILREFSKLKKRKLESIAFNCYQLALLYQKQTILDIIDDFYPKIKDNKHLYDVKQTGYDNLSERMFMSSNVYLHQYYIGNAWLIDFFHNFLENVEIYGSAKYDIYSKILHSGFIDTVLLFESKYDIDPNLIENYGTLYINAVKTNSLDILKYIESMASKSSIQSIKIEEKVEAYLLSLSLMHTDISNYLNDDVYIHSYLEANLKYIMRRKENLEKVSIIKELFKKYNMQPLNPQKNIYDNALIMAYLTCSKFYYSCKKSIRHLRKRYNLRTSSIRQMINTFVIDNNLEIIDFLNIISFLKPDDKFIIYHGAILEGKIDIVKYIDKHMTKELITRVNDKGYDHYLMAIESCNMEIIKYLEERYDCSIYKKNKKGLNALDIAKLNNRQDIIDHITIRVLNDNFKELKCNPTETSCLICKDEFEQDDSICKCYNNHRYHKDCYFEYLKENGILKIQDSKCIYCQLKMIPCTFKIENISE